MGAATLYRATSGLFDVETDPGGMFFAEKNDTWAGTAVVFDRVFVAVIATGAEAIDAGAVYKPPAEIVPVEGEPPSTPFTFQTRLMRDPLLPVVTNCALCPASSSPVFGLTLKSTSCVKLELLLDELPDAQPDKNAIKINWAKRMERL
jgi:hypothetical protein